MAKTKTPRAKLRSQLDDLVKEVVKRRDNYTCQYCHKKVSGTNCHVSHVIPVSARLSLAYDLTNLKVLCYHHHINWWHKNPLEASSWFTETFPERWNYLQKIKSLPKEEVKDWQLKEIYEQLKVIKKAMDQEVSDHGSA